MPAYRVASLRPDESGRKTFEFAKSLGVETILANPEPASLAAIDQLANEFAINVAISASQPGAFVTGCGAAQRPHRRQRGSRRLEIAQARIVE